MKILTAKETKDAEKLAFDNYFSEAQLMKRAGEESYKKIIKYFGDDIKGEKVSVVCGNGKNAGDGFVIAKLLKEFGASTEIVIVDELPKITEPYMYFNDAKEAGVPIIQYKDADFNSALIVDCIFGIGFHGSPNEPFDDVFNAINQSNAKVVSIDTPSGVNASDGSFVNAVHADLTIAISTLKYCHILPPANDYSGKVVTVNIGIPEDCYKKKYPETITKTFVKSCFHKSNKNANKGTNGHQINICGSYTMPGAAVISAKAALKSGVGLLKCIFPKSIYPVMTSNLMQCLFTPMSENEEKTFSMGAVTHITEELLWANSIVIGPGIGNNDDTQVIVNQILKSATAPIVVDADGINSLLPNINVLKESNTPIVITPHPGEMARLVGDSVETVQKDRIDTAKAFAKEFGIVVVLKGANTVVTDGNDVFVNTTGNPGMAMGGTGDMLSGMIGAFIAEGINPFDSAKAAVYIHGLCGDIVAREISERGMVIEDMLELLGALMSEFE